MKKQYLILGIVVIILVGGFYFVQGQSTSKPTQMTKKTAMRAEGTMKETIMAGVGYLMKNGEMMIEDNGKFSPMTQDITLKDGTTVTTTGQVTRKDGTTFALTEGQSMWMDGTFMKSEPTMKDEGMMNANSALSSRYINYTPDVLAKTEQSGGRTVIFFAALAWCPSCQAADKDFKTNFSKVPTDVTIVIANYDTETALKQKYNITYQDTFVQVDKDGTPITLWTSGGQGVEALLANLK